MGRLRKYFVISPNRFDERVEDAIEKGKKSMRATSMTLCRCCRPRYTTYLMRLCVRIEDRTNRIKTIASPIRTDRTRHATLAKIIIGAKCHDAKRRGQTIHMVQITYESRERDREIDQQVTFVCCLWACPTRTDPFEQAVDRKCASS